MKTTLATLLSAILTMGLSTAAFAGTAGGEIDENAGQAPDAAAAEAPAEVDFSDSELEKFVGVQGELETIRQEYSGKLESTEDADQAAKLQQEASQKMVRVVQDAGMDVETYSNIALALQSDPELRDKVEDMM